MACGPITSWQIEREKVEALADFIFLGSKLTVDCDCSHGIKRHLFLGKNALINLVHLLCRFSHVRLFVTPWTVACQTLLSMGFSRQEYWNGLPCPPAGDLPNPGIKPVSLTSPTWAGGFFTTGANDKPRQQIKKQNHHFADIGPYSQIYGFSSSHVQMWVLVHKEDWAPKSWCFWTVLLENTLESPLDCKDIKAVNPKENQPWIFIGRIVAEAEAPILWPPDVKSRFIWKNPDAGKNWRQKENEVAEDKMVR